MYICSPWGLYKSNMTERLHFDFSLSCTGEGNGNPLQCSCLENPRGSRAWWAAVCGVAQSRTGLKRLSSSSSVYMSTPVSQFIPPCFPLWDPHVCSLHLCLFLLETAPHLLSQAYLDSSPFISLSILPQDLGLITCGTPKSVAPYLF